MNLSHPISAITKLNINKLRFSTYRSAGINLIKYQNDCSNLMSILHSYCQVLSASFENLPHNIRFDYLTISNYNIDKVNKFNIKLIAPLDVNTYKLNEIYGYSKFTNSLYKLERVSLYEHFERFSYPKDLILKDDTDLLYDITPINLTLYPGLKAGVNKPLNKTIFTISLLNGFNINNLLIYNKPISLFIKGRDICNKDITEIIEITELTDYYSKLEYSYLEYIECYGNINSASVIIYPYILGKNEEFEDVIIDKEFSDIENKAKFSIDVSNGGKAILSKLLKTDTEYPNFYDNYVSFDLGIPLEDTIIDYFINKNDKVFYILTSVSIYCFPIVFPYKINKDIFKLKTRYQSCKIDYWDDQKNSQYVFKLYPSSKINDIEQLSIFINEFEYESGILLDLYREGIESNIIEIPYSELFFDNRDECIVRFETSGRQLSTLPISIFRKKIDYLYKKEISSFEKYATELPFEINGVEMNFVSPQSSDKNFYNNPDINITITENSKIFTISNSKNIYIDNYIFRSLYNTFFYNDQINQIITADSITHIKSEL